MGLQAPDRVTRAKKPAKQKPLSAAHQIFCREIVLTGNQSQAFRMAFPHSERWKEKVVWSKSSTLAHDPRIVARVQELRSITDYRLGEISVERVKQEYARLAFFDPRKLYDDNWKLKPLSELDEDTRRAIAGVELIPILSKGQLIGSSRRVKHYNKKDALDSYARIIGMLGNDAIPPAPPVPPPQAEVKMPVDPIEAAKVYKELMG